MPISYDLQHFVEAQDQIFDDVRAELVLAVKGKAAFQIFGTPDDLKFRSSMTLFSHAVPDEPMFKRALVRYFDGRDDPKTKELLARR